MRHSVVEVLEIAMEISQHTGGKVAFQYLPASNIINFHLYNTECRFSVSLDSPAAQQELNTVMDTMLDLVSEVEDAV